MRNNVLPPLQAHSLNNNFNMDMISGNVDEDKYQPLKLVKEFGRKPLDAQDDPIAFAKKAN